MHDQFSRMRPSHAVRRTLLTNVVAPIVLFQWLSRHGVPELAALAVSALPPLFVIASEAARSRKLDPIAALSLTGIVVGLVGGVLFGPHVLLVKDSFVTGAAGVVALLSTITPRPLALRVLQYFAARTSPVTPAVAAWARRATLLWGVGLCAESGLRVAISFVISPTAMVVTSPLLAASVVGPMVWYSRHTLHAAVAGAPARASTVDANAPQ